MGNTIKKVWNAVTTVLVILIVILAILLVGVRLVGFTPLAVLSGSMEPAYHVGSLIYVKSVDYRQLKAGDVITFTMGENNQYATHRIIQVVPDEDEPEVLCFATQGDANDAPDGTLVLYKNVVGTPVFTIPKLGYVANYIQNPPGKYIAISGAAILLLLMFLPDLFSEDEPKKTAESAGEEEPKKQKRSKKRGRFQR